MLSVTAMILGVCFNSAAALVSARALGAEHRGMMVAMTLVATTAYVIGGFGVPAANAYYVARKDISVGCAVANSLVMSVLVVSAGLWLLIPAARRLGSIVGIPAGEVLLAVAASGGLLLYQALNGVALGLGDFRRIRLARVLQGAVILAGTTALALTRVSGETQYFWVWMLSYGAAAVYFLTSLSVSHPRECPSLRSMRRSLRYGSRAMWSQVWETVNMRGDQYLVAALGGSAVLGVYSVAVSVIELLMHVPTALSHVVFSDSSARREGSDPRSVLAGAGRTFTWLALGGAVLTGTCVLALPRIVGEEYAAASAAVAVLVVPISALAASRMLAAREMGVGRPEVAGYGAAVSLGMTLVVDLWAVPVLGVVGAALGSSVGYVAGAGVMFALFRASGRPLREATSGLESLSELAPLSDTGGRE